MTEWPGRRVLRRTFSRLVAIVYTGGTLAHAVRLVVRFGFDEMPFFPDWRSWTLRLKPLTPS